MAFLIQETEGKAGIKTRIDSPRFRIGRGNDNELSLDDELASKLHAVIEAVEDPQKAGCFQYYIQDQQSTNHTFVNGERITLYRLSHDDLIGIGLSQFRFVDDAHDDLEETLRIQKSWIPGLYYAKKKGGRKARKKKGR
ncbi:MAG TPA: FHA domain-containing protein [Gammaproteobacteria bacterium]|nr:FHA domain-containing protein [Gammaproteobacteria bacterium]